MVVAFKDIVLKWWTYQSRSIWASFYMKQILNEHIERLQPLEHLWICPNSELLLRVWQRSHIWTKCKTWVLPDDHRLSVLHITSGELLHSPNGLGQWSHKSNVRLTHWTSNLIKVTRHLCFKNSKNLQLLDIQAFIYY